MTNYSLDTSAQVKYYVSEPGSAWVRRVVDEANRGTNQSLNHLFTAVVTVAEAAAAFAIIARIGRISQETRDRTFNLYMKTVATYFHLVAVTEDVIGLAAQLTQRHPLKGYDAVQLASALRLQEALSAKEPLAFVAADENLVDAAKAEGLKVDNPLWHIAESQP